MDRDEALRLLRGGAEGIQEWNRRRQAGEDILDLRGADLAEADLRGANLAGADLTGAILRNNDLAGVNLAEASCHDTIFAGVDLSQAEGLDSVRHAGPSHISTSTLLRSRGKIPEAFLRGCGLTNVLINFLPSLLSMLKPIQFHSCFISYSHEDEDFARQLHDRMVKEGLRVWFAPDDMQGGRTIREQIEAAIHICDKLLLVLSKASMESDWVATELRDALREEKRLGRRKLFPIRLVGYDKVKARGPHDSRGKAMAKVVAEYFIPDFSNWKDDKTFEADFDRLLRDLKAEEPPGG